MQSRPANHIPLLFGLAHLVLLGLMAGFFYAYTVDVMPALNLLEPAAAIVAMQAINEAVRNPVFFVTFFLTPFIGVIAAIAFNRGGAKKAALFSLAAAVCYFVLALIPTTLINVPMNEALASVDPGGADVDPAVIWERYAADWTFWNTARTITSCLALLLGGLALWSQRQPR